MQTKQEKFPQGLSASLQSSAELGMRSGSSKDADKTCFSALFSHLLLQPGQSSGFHRSSHMKQLHHQATSEILDNCTEVKAAG